MKKRFWEWCWEKLIFFFSPLSRCLPDAVLSLADLTVGSHTKTRRGRGKHRSYAHCTPCTHLQRDLGYDHQLQGFVRFLSSFADTRRMSKYVKFCHFWISHAVFWEIWPHYLVTSVTVFVLAANVLIRLVMMTNMSLPDVRFSRSDPRCSAGEPPIQEEVRNRAGSIRYVRCFANNTADALSCLSPTHTVTALSRVT